VVLLAACSSGDAKTESSSGGTGPEHQRVEEPPHVFNSEAAYTLTDEAYGWQAPAALHGESALVADQSGLSMVDVESGEETARVEPEHPLLFPVVEPPSNPTAQEEAAARYPDISAPVIADIDGISVALAGFPVTLPDDRGTPQPAVEIVAMRTDSGALHSTFAFEPQWPDGGPEHSASIAVLGVENDVVAIRLDPDDSIGSTYGIALPQRELAWEREDFQAIGYSRGILAGGLFDEGADWPVLAGVSLAHGEELWRSDQGGRSLRTVGEAGALVEATEQLPQDEEGDVQRLVDIASGRTFYAFDDDLDNSDCHHDLDAAAVVCDGEDHGAVALDGETAEVLWQDPDWTGTIASLWHGALYVDRSEGPVVLDTRTGETVESNPGIAPNLVNAHAALVHAGNTVEVYHIRH
jgi:hypothetical protein